MLVMFFYTIKTNWLKYKIKSATLYDLYNMYVCMFKIVNMYQHLQSILNCKIFQNQLTN